MNKEYYKAYEERYKDSHNNNMLWELPIPTEELIDIIDKYNIKKNMDILEIGCGEGRDAINLLNNNYNVLGVDYSKTAIKKCNELTNNKYQNNFKQLDIIKDKLNKKFDFIYSVAVIHMFIDDNHRNKFYNFIYEHLKENGIALIISMGDGITKYKTNPNDAYKKVTRTNSNTGKQIETVSTTCNIVTINELKEEITNNNLNIIDIWISDKIPSFDKCICALVKRS